MHKSLLFSSSFLFLLENPRNLGHPRPSTCVHKCTTGSFPWGTCDSLLFHPSAPIRSACCSKVQHPCSNKCILHKVVKLTTTHTVCYYECIPTVLIRHKRTFTICKLWCSPQENILYRICCRCSLQHYYHRIQFPSLRKIIRPQKSRLPV